MHLIAVAAIERWQWPRWELARLCLDVCNYSAAQKGGAEAVPEQIYYVCGQCIQQAG